MDDATTHQPWRAWTAGLASALVLFLLVQGVGFALASRSDLDQDGLSANREAELGLRAHDPDSDDDGLTDGFEVEHGFDPKSNDTDLDGLLDGREVRLGSNVTSSDTDGDTLLDGEEDPERLANRDCNGDGIPSIRTADDDADGRLDRSEDVGDRCDPDVDDDGVLDGNEGNLVCLRRPDCDADGLPDGSESGTGFDALDPDSFDTHLPDGVSFAFASQGQTPGTDDDQDGIPDPWEDTTGLIDWGPFDPKAGQRDLLVEFVRVLGPHSSRLQHLDPDPAYRSVRDAFARATISMQYVETLVRLEAEPNPDLLPTRTAQYYQDILDAARHSENPYVLTVVLNPRHNQTDVVHAGVAPIRGMLAAVDVGQFIEVDWRDVEGNYSIRRVSPFVESLIVAGRLDPDKTVGGMNTDGTFFLILGGREIRWEPSWLSNPRILHVHPLTGQSRWVGLIETRQELLVAPLAHTILHEMGHTLGLCHTHDAACAAMLPLDQQSRTQESSMSYESPEALVDFLPGEWDRARAQLVCPPPEPIRALAANETADQVLASKYSYTLDDSGEANVRSCQDLQPIARTLHFIAAPPAYEPSIPRDGLPTGDADGARRFQSFTRSLGLVVALIGGLAGALLTRRFR